MRIHFRSPAPRTGDAMWREMITLPLRIAVSAARLGVRVTEQAAGMVFGGARHILEAALAGEAHPAAADGAAEGGAVRLGVIIASSRPTSETTSDRAADDEARAATSSAEARRPPSTSRPDVAPASSQASSGPSPALSAPVAATAAPPTHVSEELEFVEGFAEPGAEEGAGAEVHVIEPWNGYAHLTANEIIAKLADATREELAAVLLYEGVHRCRRTVLAAAERQLARASEGAEHARARH